MEEAVPMTKEQVKKAKNNEFTRYDIKTISVEDLMKAGIPLKRVVFHDVVTSWGASNTSTGEPETALYDPSGKAKPSRTAKMWYTPLGVLCEQRGKYKLIPLANVKDTDLA